jgi:hypothetical protein
VHLAQCCYTMLDPPINDARGEGLAACRHEVLEDAQGLRRSNPKVQLHTEDGEKGPPHRTKTCTAMLCRAEIS